jgi:dCTP diphosphatase
MPTARHEQGGGFLWHRGSLAIGRSTLVWDALRPTHIAPAGGKLPGMKKPTNPRRDTVKKMDSWQDLTAAIRRFRDERDWSQFHTPKNLAAAIAIEASELQEQFLWKTDKEIDRNLKGGPKREAVVEEIADVVMFALLLADRLDIDVAKAITDKLAANELKYPVALARGNARKYTELREP